MTFFSPPPPEPGPTRYESSGIDSMERKLVKALTEMPSFSSSSSSPLCLFFSAGNADIRTRQGGLKEPENGRRGSEKNKIAELGPKKARISRLHLQKK